MRYETFLYDREKIYKEVWDEPVTIVAKRYGISDVAFHKLCKRLEVPVPPRGYWSQIKAGEKLQRPPLTKLSDPRKILGRRYLPDPESKLIEDRVLEKGSQTSFDNRLHEVCSNVAVKKRLVNLHPLVEEAGQYLKTRKENPNWPIHSTTNEMLDIAVSKDQIERALRIFDALIRTIEELGFAVRVYKNQYDRYGRSKQGTYVEIGEQELPIKLIEKTNRIEHVKTPPEKAGKKTQYTYEPPYDFVPSGILTLQLDYYWASRKNWNDGKNKKLEDKIGEIVLSLVKTSEEMAIRDEIRNEKEQRRRQEEQRKQEIQERREKEIKRFHKLEKAAQEWQRAQMIDAYIEAVKAAMEKQALDAEQKEQLEQWIRWAKGKVDWLNPLTGKSDPVLGKRNIDKDN